MRALAAAFIYLKGTIPVADVTLSVCLSASLTVCRSTCPSVCLSVARYLIIFRWRSHTTLQTHSSVSLAPLTPRLPHTSRPRCTSCTSGSTKCFAWRATPFRSAREWRSSGSWPSRPRGRRWSRARSPPWRRLSRASSSFDSFSVESRRTLRWGGDRIHDLWWFWIDGGKERTLKGKKARAGLRKRNFFTNASCVDRPSPGLREVVQRTCWGFRRP